MCHGLVSCTVATSQLARTHWGATPSLRPLITSRKTRRELAELYIDQTSGRLIGLLVSRPVLCGMASDLIRTSIDATTASHLMLGQSYSTVHAVGEPHRASTLPAWQAPQARLVQIMRLSREKFMIAIRARLHHGYGGTCTLSATARQAGSLLKQQDCVVLHTAVVSCMSIVHR